MIEQSPQRLLRRCAQTNDDSSWEAFLRQYGPRFRAGVRRALARAGADDDGEREEEMLQEVYCRLLERGRRALFACRGSSEAEIGAYLLRVSETAVLDRLRAERARKRGGDRRFEANGAGAESLEERLLSAAPSAEDRLHLEELRARFQESCRTVCGASDRNRWILEAAFLEGCSSREIAARLAGEIEAASVDSVLYRMRRRFDQQGLRLPLRRSV